MVRAAVISLACVGLVSPFIQGTIHSPNANQAFIEAQLCTTGQIIRIPLSEPEDDIPSEKHVACHALCARDQDEEESA